MEAVSVGVVGGRMIVFEEYVENGKEVEALKVDDSFQKLGCIFIKQFFLSFFIDTFPEAIDRLKSPSLKNKQKHHLPFNSFSSY